jgi:excisionase family DNA binding protein
MAVVEAPAPIQTTWITMDEARKLIGCGRPKVDQLIKRGVLRMERNVFQRRQRLVNRFDVERVAREGVDGMRRTPRQRARGKV